MEKINNQNAKQWSRLGPRAMFGQFMLEVAEKFDNLMVLSADLGRSSGLDRFKKQAFCRAPKKEISLGSPEQNAVLLTFIWRHVKKILDQTINLCQTCTNLLVMKPMEITLNWENGTKVSSLSAILDLITMNTGSRSLGRWECHLAAMQSILEQMMVSYMLVG